LKKDILIMCQYFYPEYVSSATLPTEMAEDLVGKGFSVDVLCGYPLEYYRGNKKVPKKEKFCGIQINRVKYFQVKRESKFGRLINFFSIFFVMLLRLPTLLQYRCILVYSNPPILPLIPVLAKLLFGTKFIFVVYDIYPDLALILKSIRSGSIIEKIMNFINRLVYCLASRIVVLGTEMKDYLLAKKIVSKPERVEVIPNWYDINKIQVNIEKNKFGFSRYKDEGKFVVVYSGNMGTCQDMDTIMEAMKVLKNDDQIQFILTGHGNKTNLIKNFIENNNIKNARMYGFLLGAEYCELLNSASCFLVSLERDIEGLSVPSKTYSYLASGCPVLAIMSKETDIARMLSKYKAGFTVSQNDVRELAKYILYLKKDSGQCQQMGENARKVFEELYERKICVHKYQLLIESIIEDNRV
jgi:glycosyltransferase involved in cell wall biosynthesis